MEFAQEFFSTGGFIPHGHCYLWKPGLVWLHLLSDLSIGLAYYSIPFGILYFTRERQDLPFEWMFQLFSIFILLCGTTHFLAIWTLWLPIYWVSGALKMVTAIVSVYTAIRLIPLIPQALALPSPRQLEAANHLLEVEIAERRRAEAEIRELNAELEDRVRERTLKISMVNTELEKEVADRKQAEERFNIALKNSPITVFTQDSDLRYTWVYNPALGFDASQVLGKSDLEILPLEEAQKLTMLKQQVLDKGKGIREEVSLTLNAEMQYFDLTIEPTIDRIGSIVGISCVAADITNSKLAEAELRKAFLREATLLKEIHHRVKNNLQIVSGLLYLQTHQVSDKKMQAILQSSRDRIQSMALIHEKLYRISDLENIDFVAYLFSLVRNLETAYMVESKTISLNIQAPPIHLDIDTAIYCGLVVNELVSNAYKYAFPDRMSGEICIEFQSPSPDNFVLIVSDNGVGVTELIDLANSQGLGLQLVHSLVTQQLNGTVVVADNDGGMRFRVEFSKQSQDRDL